MIIETEIVTLLRALAPAYYGTAPQPPSDEPTPMPVIVVNRVAARWPLGFGGTDGDLSLVTVQADYYAETAELARQLADRGRLQIAEMVVAGEPVAPALENEFSMRDDIARASGVSAMGRDGLCAEPVGPAAAAAAARNSDGWGTFEP